VRLRGASGEKPETGAAAGRAGDDLDKRNAGCIVIARDDKRRAILGRFEREPFLVTPISRGDPKRLTCH